MSDTIDLRIRNANNAEDFLHELYDCVWAWYEVHPSVSSPLDRNEDPKRMEEELKKMLTKASARYAKSFSYPPFAERYGAGRGRKSVEQKCLEAIEEGLVQADREERLTRPPDSKLPFYDGRLIPHKVLVTFIQERLKYPESTASKYARVWLRAQQGPLQIKNPDFIIFKASGATYWYNKKTGAYGFDTP